MSATTERRKALVTGATGFLGSRLARCLARDGWEVHVMVRPTSDLQILAGVTAQLTFHKLDDSTPGLIETLGRIRPDIVFHLASLFVAEHEPKHVEHLVRSNVLFATQLVEAMTQSCTYRLVNTGTSWQHFHNREYAPVCLYAATKQAFEAILTFYLDATPLRAITLKLFDTYGPGDPRRKLFTLLRTAAREGKPLCMSAGAQLLDLVYVDDVVEAFLGAAMRLLNDEGEKHEHYAVSSQSPIRLRDLVELYEKVTGSAVPVRWSVRPYRVREVMVPWNTGRLLPGWRAKVGLQEGIQKMETLT